MSTLASVFGYGLLSARPAASVAGRFYYATDTTLMYRDNGSTWDTLSVGTGSMATDGLWDAAGDLAQGTGANTGAKLSAGLVGQYLASAGAAAANLWKYPPGYEFDYAQITAGVTVTATTEGTAQTVVDGNAVTYDGSTIVLIEFYCDVWYTAATATADAFLLLFEDSTDLGIIASIRCTSTTRNTEQVRTARRLTPSAGSHTYHVKAYSTASGAIVDAGAGNGTGVSAPAFLRITKV